MATLPYTRFSRFFFSFVHTKLDRIQLMANDSCKMAWINLIYLRKNWQSEGQRINKSWQSLLDVKFLSLSVWYDSMLLFFRDNSISFNLVVVASVCRLWWRIALDIGGLSSFLAGSIQFLLIIQIACNFFSFTLSRRVVFSRSFRFSPTLPIKFNRNILLTVIAQS